MFSTWSISEHKSSMRTRQEIENDANVASVKGTRDTRLLELILETLLDIRDGRPAWGNRITRPVHPINVDDYMEGMNG